MEKGVGSVSKTRLNNADREEIANDVVEIQFRKTSEEIAVERAVLTDRVYRVMYNESERKLMQNAPSGAFATVKLSTDMLRSIHALDDRLVFARDRYPDHEINPESDLGKRLVAYATSIDEAEKKRKDDKIELTALLSLFKTWEQIETEWPELWQTIKHLKPIPKVTNLPALPVATLNTRFGLPAS